MHWKVSRTPLFDQSLRDNTRIFQDLPERVDRFIRHKITDPLSARYGKHDRPFTGELVGFWHTHLRDDAVLIYNFSPNRCLNLVYIASHAEIEGRRLRLTRDRLKQFNLSAKKRR